MRYVVDHQTNPAYTESEDESLDKLFFCLHNIRTGPLNIELAGVKCGWTARKVDYC